MERYERFMCAKKKTKNDVFIHKISSLNHDARADKKKKKTPKVLFLYVEIKDVQSGRSVNHPFNV